jgi:serine phosphatase RsbU (regulator of sigma subunit)
MTYPLLNHVVGARSFRAAQYLAPLEEVGGALLWHWQRPVGTTDIVIGDVMGHGPTAARLAIRITGLLDELAPASGGVSAKVSALNRALLQRRYGGPHTATEFATGLHLRLHPQEARVAVCSFAHCRHKFAPSLTG